MGNKYHDAMMASNSRITAENLLSLLRLEIAPILKDWSETTAPSQSAQAISAMDALKKSIAMSKESLGLSKTFLDATKEARRHLRLLEDFMAVHRTVWILEGRAIQ